ncbi:hypothetical protein S83_039734 [Arachis hypogaea]
MEWRKCYVDTRCSPNLLATLCSDYLNDAQRNEVRAMGFGSLLGIPKGNLNHDLILALANAYNPSKFHLLTPIGKVDVTWDSVAAVLGLRAYGDPFKEVTKEHEPMLLEFKKKSPNVLRQIMVENPRGGPRFRRAFLLYALITFLLPINTTMTRDKIFPFIIDVDNPTKYNWVRCIVDGLTDGVNNFKEGVVSSLNGCIYMLQILYFHKQKYGPFDFEKEPQPPWLPHWTKELIYAQIALERKSSSGLVKSKEEQPVPKRQV